MTGLRYAPNGVLSRGAKVSFTAQLSLIPDIILPQNALHHIVHKQLAGHSFSPVECSFFEKIRQQKGSGSGIIENQIL
jgi:hypothetical protein